MLMIGIIGINKQMDIVIIKYNAGNTQSVLLALERLGYSARISHRHDVIRSADRVIFPGVGQARSAMDSLIENGLNHLIPQLSQPVLGICLGMQLLCSHSQEGDIPCLNIIPETVKLFQGNLKIPHMGWNILHKMESKIFDHVKPQSYAYFVHSYFVPVNAYTIATSDYAIEFSAAVKKDNFYGVQFHPEKSGEVGQQILKNFLQDP